MHGQQVGIEVAVAFGRFSLGHVAATRPLHPALSHGALPIMRRMPCLLFLGIDARLYFLTHSPLSFACFCRFKASKMPSTS